MQETFAERLEQLIKERELTLLGMARELGVSRQTIYNWLNTDRITQKNLTALAVYFGVSAQWLRYGHASAGEQGEDAAGGLPLTGRRKRLIENIIRNERVLQMAIDASSLAIWEYSLIHDQINWVGAGRCMACANPKGETSRLAQLLARIHEEDRSAFEEMLGLIMEQGGMDSREVRLLDPEGGIVWCVATISEQLDEHQRRIGVLGSLRDISQEKLAAVALRESESRFRAIFDHSPVSLWEEDFSQVKGYLDKLRGQGVIDLEEYLVRHPEAVQHCAQLTRIIDVNQAAIEMHRARGKADLLQNLVNTFVEESYEAFARELLALWRGELRFKTAAVIKTLDGQALPVHVLWTVEPGNEDSLERVIVSIITREITS